MQLPAFLIIGAMRSGTSSLRYYLRQQPAVYASERKELDFFTRHYDRGLDWYREQFGPGVAGEASPNYLKAHIWPQTAARIREHLPQARLVCVLRHPIDRALSHHLHSRWRGRGYPSLARALRPDTNVVMTSRYGWQLDHYLAHFPADQILLVATEELDRDPEAVVRRVSRFIGVDDTVTVDTSARRNATAANFSRTGAPMPDDPDLVVEGDRTTMSERARAALARELAPDVDRLRQSWPQFPGWDLAPG